MKIFNLILLLGMYMHAQVGINTDYPDPSAIVDLGPGNKALMLPQVALLANDDITTVPNPTNGMVVYNTTDNVELGLVANNYYYFNSEYGKWVALINTKYAEDKLDEIKPPLYVGQMFKTNQQNFSILNGTGVNVISFAPSESTSLFNYTLLERLPGSNTTFKILRSGIYVFEGYSSFKFDLSGSTFWTLALQSGVSDDSDTSVPSTFTIGMRCPYYSYEAASDFFTTCNFTGAVYLEADEIIRLVAVKKNGSNPTAGQIGDGVNYSAGLKIIYFTPN